jgi:TRAP-type mannitol/chloroaromatic compound transport system permease small subunit
MQVLIRLADAIDTINAWIGKIVAWLTLVMIVLGFINVVLRYSGRWLEVNLTSNMALEAQWYMFGLVFLLLGAYTLQQDRHVRVDVLYSRLGPRGQAWIDLVGAVVFLVPFCVLIVWMCWPFVAAAVAVWESSPDPGGLPRWPIKLAIPLGCVLLAVQGVAMAIRSAAVLTGYVDMERA